MPRQQASPRRTQQERRDETERRVLAAATAIVARHGSRALTLAQVGEAAGYSRGIVTHHFGNRENLLRAVMRDAQTFALPEHTETAADWVTATVRAYLENVAGRGPSARAFLQMWSEAIAADPVLMPLYAESDAGFRRLLAGRVRDGIRDGSIRPDADPQAVAVLLIGLLRGIALQLISTPPPRRVAAIIDEAERSTRRMLGRTSG
ncbi:TetR/AcrR family transcriptional regulator [Jatrophihabitans sp. YIM 134969]